MRIRVLGAKGDEVGEFILSFEALWL